MNTLLVVLITVWCTGFVFLLVLNLASPERPIHYDVDSKYSIYDPPFERAMSHLLGPPLVDGNHVTTLINGDQIFPPMLAAIRAAKETITFETYIYWSGQIGHAFADALAERAKAGVRVHVLLDWVGSNRLDEKAINQMSESGAQVERYRPLRWYNLSRMNSRTHRKILVVDGKVGFIGGVGIADHWTGNAESVDHWRDTHYKLEGPAVAHLQAAFLDNWIKTRAEVLFQEQYFPDIPIAGDERAQVFKSSPREGSESVRLMFIMSIAAADERILIANSYFVPDNQCVDALVDAQKRGVQVEVIVPGRHIDTQVTRHASRSRWGKLLEAGVAIYEYQPTMYHCKVMVIDNGWVSVGSTNFDNRSFRLNDEANLNVFNQAFAEEQAAMFEADKLRSRRITLDEWKKRPPGEKAIDSLAGLFRAQF